MEAMEISNIRESTCKPWAHLTPGFLVAHRQVKNTPAAQKTWVHALGWEDTLEKAMATHSSYSCLEVSMGRGKR